MEKNQVDQLIVMNASKIPLHGLNIVRQKLENADYTSATIVLSQLKDPTISLILSICLGGFGVDRFYIGDVGLGVGKLVTCGGIYIWWLIDIFLISDATREKNLQTLMTQLP